MLIVAKEFTKPLKEGTQDVQEEKDDWSAIEIDWSLTLSSIEVDLKEFLKRAKSRK